METGFSLYTLDCLEKNDIYISYFAISASLRCKNYIKVFALDFDLRISQATFSSDKPTE